MIASLRPVFRPLLILVTALPLLAAPVVTAWQPLFKGIDYLTGTNSQSGGDFNNLMVAHVLRINLTDPDIRLLPTPRHTNYVVNSAETQGRTVSQFVKAYGVQVAVNANFFSPEEYYLPEGTAMRVDGLSISEGSPVSPANFSRAACVLFDAANVGQILHANWPAAGTNGVLNAVAGDISLVINGVNARRSSGDVNPRSAMGLSQDGKTLFLLTIDGRQPGYSEGAYDHETAAWMLLVGAYNAVSMDGGGSATMVRMSSTGQPIRVNSSSAVANDTKGRERTVGSHLGIFAKPVPAFVNDITVTPEDETATITWTTTAPATSQVEYGLTESLGQSSAVSANLVSTHAVGLTGLTPGTGYYFRAVSEANGQRNESALQFFTTTRTVTATEVIPLNGQWRHTSADVSGSNWTAPGFNDSGWDGPAAGVLWAYTRAGDPPLDLGLLGGRLDGNPGTGLPYVTYYFRTHFTATTTGLGTSLAFNGYLDDGAVFYLNGHEFYRLRMPEAPEEIANSTIATSLPCGGDADCPDTFTVKDGVSDHLVAGDNVLAVEVHNSNARSSDITFGFAVTLEQLIPSTLPQLGITLVEGQPVLNWTGGGATLQQADSPAGPWNNVPGPVTTGPFTVTDTEDPHFYRLSR